MTTIRPSASRSALLAILLTVTAMAVATGAAAQDGPGPDGEDEVPLAPPPGTVSSGPDATHLLHVEIDAHLYDEDRSVGYSFDPGPDQVCVHGGDLWIEAKATDGTLDLDAIGPVPPGTLRSPTPVNGPVVDRDGAGIGFTCDKEISLCWWGSTVTVLPTGDAVLRLEVLLFEADPFLGAFRACNPDDLVDTATITVVASPDHVRRCNRGPIDHFAPVLVGEVQSDGANVRACLSNHPLDELASFWASLQSGTTHAVGSLTVAVDAQATAYGGIAEYRWEWGDGTSTRTASAGLVQHSYRTPGRYDIRVTATPNRPGTAPGTIWVARVVVLAPPGAPTAVIDAPDRAQPGEPVIVDASGSSPGSGREGDIAEYRWDLGDGTRITLDAFRDQSWEHSYADEGEYTVTLTATAMNGQEDTTTHRIVVG